MNPRRHAKARLRRFERALWHTPRFWALNVFLLLLVMGGYTASRYVLEPEVNVGEPAPPFVLEDGSGTVNLGEVLRRRPIVLVFFRGDACEECRVQLERLRPYVLRMKHAGIEVFAITSDDGAGARRTASALSFEIPVMSDRPLKVFRRYAMLSDPPLPDVGYVVIDRAGTVRLRKIDQFFGEHSEEMVRFLESLC